MSCAIKIMVLLSTVVMATAAFMMIEKLFGNTLRNEQPKSDDLQDYINQVYKLGNDVETLSMEMKLLKDKNALLIKQNRELFHVVRNLQCLYRDLRKETRKCAQESKAMDEKEENAADTESDDDQMKSTTCNNGSVKVQSEDSFVYTQDGEVYGMLARHNDRIEHLTSIVESQLQLQGRMAFSTFRKKYLYECCI